MKMLSAIKSKLSEVGTKVQILLVPVENFFAKEVKNATLVKTILIVIISAFLLAVLTSGIKLPREMALTYLSLAATQIFIRPFVFPIIVGFLLSYGYAFFWLGKKSNKTLSLLQCTYIFSSIILFFDIGLLSFFIIPPLPPLLFALFLSIPTLILISTKSLHKVSYPKAFLHAIIVSNIGAILTVVLMLLVMLSWVVVTEFIYHPTYQTAIVDHPDGSFTVTYAESSKLFGTNVSVCNITFPKGWEYKDKIIFDAVFQQDRGYIPEEFYPGVVFYRLGTPVDEKGFTNITMSKYLYFMDEPLGLYADMDCSRGPWPNPKGFTESVQANYSLNQERLFETCESSGINNETNMMRTYVDASFIGKVGRFSLVYQSKIGDSSDLYKILDSMVCKRF